MHLNGNYINNVRTFVTGAVRDTDEGKPDMDLLPWELLFRLAYHYTAGAKKYGKGNWRKGQPKSATFASLMRHAVKYRMGMTDEDHLSAIIWNAFSLMHVDNTLLRDHPELGFVDTEEDVCCKG